MWIRNSLIPAFLFSLPLLAFAQTLDFETPDYAYGQNLGGQDGWLNFPLVQLSNPADFKIHTDGSGNQLVEGRSGRLTENYRIMDEQAGVVELKWRWMAGHDSVNLCLGIADSLTKTNNNWAAYRTRFCFDGPSGKWYAKGAAFPNMSTWPTWSPNRWYYVRIRHDLEQNTYSLFLDTLSNRTTETALVVDLPAGGTGPVKRILLKSDYGAGFAYLDDITWNAASPEMLLEVVITSPSQDTLVSATSITVQYLVNAMPHSKSVSLVEGQNQVVIDTTDLAGQFAADSVTITLDTQAPVVAITSPSAQSVFTSTPITVAWSVDGIAQNEELSEDLQPGEHWVVRSATDPAGNTGLDSVKVFLEETGPLAQIITPANGFQSAQAQVTFQVELLASGLASWVFLIDGADRSADFQATGNLYAAQKSLEDGYHTFWVIASTHSGRADTVKAGFKVLAASIPTQIDIAGRVLNGKTFDPISGATVTVRETGSQVLTGLDGRFILPSGGFGAFKLDITHPQHTEAMRRVSISAGQASILPPILILPLDTQAVEVLPGVATTIALADAKVEIDIPAGAVSSALSLSATVYDDIGQLPNEQPSRDVFLFGVDLKPSGTTFSESLNVRVVNSRELSVGAIVPITYFNKTSGIWDSVGTGTVTADGSFIQFKVNHFSTFHGNAYSSAGGNSPGEGGDCAGTCPGGGDGCGGAGGDPGSSTASFVSSRTGELQLDYTIPGGAGFSDLDIRLVYLSSSAKPRKLLSLSMKDIDLKPTYSAWSLYLPEGRKHWLFHGPTESSLLQYAWEGKDANQRDLETGLYPYGMKMTDILMPGRYRYDVSQAQNLGVQYDSPTNIHHFYYGYATIVNRKNSPYGAGWAVDGITRIVRKKGNLAGPFPQKTAFRLLEDSQRHTSPDGLDSVSAIDVATALGGVQGDLVGDHVSIIGSGAAGSIYWQIPGSNRYRPPHGLHDTLIFTNPGWIRKKRNGLSETYDESGLLLSRMDARGHQTLFEYDVFGERLLRIIDNTTGRATYLRYGADGKLNEVEDSFGKVTRITLDGQGNLTGIQTPDGILQRQYEYDSQHLVTRKKIPGGASSRYFYDTWGSIIKTVSPESLETFFQLPTEASIVNALSEVAPGTVEAFVPDKSGNIQDYSTQPIHSMPKSKEEKHTFRDGLGSDMEYEFNAFGLVKKKINAKGETTLYSYDSQCGCGEASSIEYPNGLIITNKRDKKGNLVETHNSVTGALTTYSYVTIKGREYIQTLTNALGQQTHFSYDSLGNLTRLIAPGPDTTRITYDARSLPVSVTDPAGRTVTTSYDSLGRVLQRINPKGDTTSYAYDEAGNMSEAT